MYTSTIRGTCGRLLVSGHWHQCGSESHLAFPSRHSFRCLRNHQRAVAILSDSRLNRDYASKILQALALAENSTPLILKYIRTAKPLLVEPDDLGLYITALTETNLLDAWQFQRTFPENRETRLRLIRKIFEWCLSRECSKRSRLSSFLSRS